MDQGNGGGTDGRSPMVSAAKGGHAMKRTMVVCSVLVMVVLFGTGAVAAQHPAGGGMPMCGQAGPQEQTGGPPPAMGKGVMGQKMRMPMGCQMCPMMGGMM